ncbi:MAG: hypothetical protein HY303_03670 [Candidatus Wallbacteria bacterium]|nr:hypothetical protein [Candidatus Wallbacteria bacterium]
MHVTQIIPDKCTGCEDCVFVCTIKAIKMVGGKAVVQDGCNDCKDCWKRCSDGAIFHGEETGAAEAAAPQKNTSDWRGVLVWLEGAGSGLGSPSREALAAGRRLADDLGVYLEAYVVGGVESAQDAVARGADRVHRHAPAGAHTSVASAFEASLLTLIRDRRYEIVLFPDSLSSWELAPRVAQRLETALYPPVCSLSVDFESRDLLGTIHAYGGKLFSEITTSGARPQITLVGKNAFPETAADPTREGEIVEAA